MAIPLFRTKITRARVTMSQFSSADMFDIGEKFNLTMKRRITDALTIEDQPAPPLTEKYKKRKAAKTPFLIRNLWYSGDMLRTMRVLRVDQNSFVIHFTATPVMSRRMMFNQRRAPQWGVSPKDKAELMRLFESRLNVNIERGESKVLVA